MRLILFKVLSAPYWSRWLAGSTIKPEIPGTSYAGAFDTDGGRWTMDDGRWTMDDGRWLIADGR